MTIETCVYLWVCAVKVTIKTSYILVCHVSLTVLIQFNRIVLLQVTLLHRFAFCFFSSPALAERLMFLCSTFLLISWLV